jgi:hypothetical protein
MAPLIIRYARRHLGFLFGLVIAAVAIGITYRYLFDPLEEREPSYYLRSCLHAIGLAFSGWAVHVSLAAAPRTRLLGMLRRLPQPGELAIKVVVMTTVLTIAAVALQLILYSTPHFSQYWLRHHLPWIVGLSFAISLLAGALFEFQTPDRRARPWQLLARDLPSAETRAAHRHVPGYCRFDRARRAAGRGCACTI